MSWWRWLMCRLGLHRNLEPLPAGHKALFRCADCGKELGPYADEKEL